MDFGKHRVVPTTCYAAGLRFSKAIRPKAAVIDSARMVVREGKGCKDQHLVAEISPRVDMAADIAEVL